MNSGKPLILVVEDEEHLAKGLRLNLELEGYQVVVAPTSREAASAFVEHSRFAAVILDVMLPDLDGFAFCRKLRESNNFVPVMMLTARHAPEDRVRGLESGADDYVVKPFDLNELLARLRSMLRRQGWEQNGVAANSEATLRFGARALVNFDTHEVTVEGQEVHLTQLELDLLRFFASNPERVISREELLEKVWKLRGYSNTRTVDNFIGRLRRHFEVEPTDPQHFISVRGAGYRFVPP